MSRDVTLMGVPLDPLTEAETVAAVGAAVERGSGGWVLTANLDHLRLSRDRPELRLLFARADLVVPDGTPLVWASRIQGTPLPERVAGSNLVWSLSEAAAGWGAPVFLLGGNPGVAEQAAERLVESFPGLRIAGTLCPPVGFEWDRAHLDWVADELLRAQPTIVYVALGFPKQEQVIDWLRRKLPGTWFLGLGISLSFVAGEVTRAPPWMQRLGIEWLHRMAQEPRRLLRRYLVHGLPFGARLLATSALSRRGPTRAGR